MFIVSCRDKSHNRNAHRARRSEYQQGFSKLTSTVAKKIKKDYETRLFINGEFVNSVSGKTFPVVDPTTEEVICQVQEAAEADVNKAVEAARAAFAKGSDWRTMPSSKRRDLMLKLADLIERDRPYLAEIESLNNGKPLAADGTTYGSFADLHLVVQCLRYCTCSAQTF